MAIIKASSPPIHLEIQRKRSRVFGLLRSTFREDGKIKHKNHGRISGVGLDQLKLIQMAMRGRAVPEDSPEALRLLGSKEYGASAALLALAQQLELPKILYSRNEPWVQSVLAMIVGRVLYAGSKLSLCHQTSNTALWELCGVAGPVDVDQHCYRPLDRLLERQQAIQRALAKRHMSDGQLVLYDITSSYFEGQYEDSELVAFGYNRDGKRGHEQIVIGLLCNAEGCPVAVEVFAGNTQDASTVVDKIEELKNEYGLKEIVFVGDRGMVTAANARRLDGVEGLRTISALTHREIVGLLERKVIQPELFDEKQIVEVIDPDDPTRRYCLCRNPEQAARETRCRDELIERTRLALEKIAARKTQTKAETIGAQVGRLLARTKMGKFIQWSVSEGRLTWSVQEQLVKDERRWDGCYIISSNVPAEQLDRQRLVASYKSLSLVEQAFRNLKTVSLEMRPVYHRKDDRIRAHVFLCMLAYYVQWHATRRLRPLFDGDGTGANRRWTVQGVFDRLKGIRQQRLRMAGVEFTKITEADEEQRSLIELLEKP